MKVVVTGATGFVGRPLVAALAARGDAVTALVRDPARAGFDEGVRVVAADLESAGDWRAELAGAGAVIHLAGEPIGGRRWDARQKQLLRDSRVESARQIVEAIAAAAPADRPRALISASGADYYPFALEISGTEADADEVTEADPPADDFIGRLCRAWEAEALAARAHGVRVCVMRTGLVLGSGGGALAKLVAPFKAFVGGRLGSGRQFMSWIHLDDAVAAYAAAAHDDRFAGPLNLVAGSTRNADFARALGRALHRPSAVRTPAFAVRLAAGELADYVLHGRNVVPAKLRALGFAFAHPELDGALAAAV